MSQPSFGVNQNPLVFAQISNGISPPEVSDARIITSVRVITITSNMFLHLFYNKPFVRSAGFNYATDQELDFYVKDGPSEEINFPETILDLFHGESDGGEFGNFQPRPEFLSEAEVLTMSSSRTWRFNPVVMVSEFFAQSLGVPIDCWTPCSRFEIARELQDSDRLKYTPNCGGARRSVCFMTPGELAHALHPGDSTSFDESKDLSGYVQLSVLFKNKNPKVQPLDFRCRFRVVKTTYKPFEGEEDL